MIRYKNRHNKGIALLTSVLIMSVILAIGLSLMTYVVKQLDISFSTRNSAISIYAADAGVECALLWDIKSYDLYGGPVFATSTGSARAVPGGIGSGPARCFGRDLASTWEPIIEDAISATTTFNLQFSGSPVYCTRVTVTKFNNGSKIETSILSRGYNVPCNQRTTSVNAVERAIRVDYVFF